MREIILASGSPRRRELLEQIGIPFQIKKSNAEEKITGTVPAEIVKELSAQKAADVAETVEEGIVLGADTIVCLNGKIMGKPGDRAEAKEMLRALQGRTHSVYTGVTFIRKDRQDKADTETSTGRRAGERMRSFAVETRVRVHEMTEEEIEDYLDTGDAFDKAGSYGIQGPFAAYIDGIEGDYYNVVGLPVSAVYREWKSLLAEEK